MSGTLARLVHKGVIMKGEKVNKESGLAVSGCDRRRRISLKQYHPKYIALRLGDGVDEDEVSVGKKRLRYRDEDVGEHPTQFCCRVDVSERRLQPLHRRGLRRRGLRHHPRQRLQTLYGVRHTVGVRLVDER